MSATPASRKALWSENWRDIASPELTTALTAPGQNPRWYRDFLRVDVPCV